MVVAARRHMLQSARVLKTRTRSRRVPAPRIRIALPLAIALASLTLGGVSGGEETTTAGSLDLEALVVEARKKHPDMAVARRAAASAHQIPSRVGSFPDPVALFSVQNLRIDDPTLDAHPMTGLVFGLAQVLPYPGKLPRRERVAEARAAVADRRTELVDTDVALRVRRLYWRLHYAERAAAIVAENEKVLDMLTNVVHARFAVGQGAQQDALQAQVAHSRLRTLLKERRQVVTSAQRALSGAVGRAPKANLAPTRAPGPMPKLLRRAELVDLVKRGSPAVVVGTAGVEMAQHALAEAKWDRRPDFQVGLGWRSRLAAPGDASEGADMVTFTFGGTIPIWMGSKQNARVRQEYQSLWRARAEVDAVTLQATTAAERIVDAVDRLSAEISLYRVELLPQADEALDASIADYQVASVGFVSVLQNWRADLEIKLSFERLLAERAERLAELRALVGGPIAKGEK